MTAGAPSSRWHRAGLAAFTGLGTLCLVGTFLPWLRMGSRSRSSYDLFGLVDRLGFAPDGAIGVLVRAWPLVPLLFTLAVIVNWWGRLTIGLVAATVAAMYVGGVSIALLVGASGTPVEVETGAVVSSIASAAFFVNALVLQITGRLRSESSDGPPVPSPHAPQL